MLPATPAQQTLIRYWQQLPRAEGQACPARRAVNPFHLGHALSDITLVETGGAQGPVIRLAGSSITALAGRPLRGLAVDSLDGPLAGLWRRGVDEALASGGPVHDRIASPIAGRDLAWLRLPLLDGDGVRRLVMCHDCWVRPQRPAAVPMAFIPRGSSSIAA